MPFRVFPDASNGPLSLGPGQISAPIAFPETAGGTPPAVFLRIVMLGDGCEPPDAPRPAFQLRAGVGNPVLLPDDDAVFIRAVAEAASAPVARAQLFIESEHVYAIRILIDRPGSTWQLRMTNNDDAERKFTWVVADNEPESAQPWLNLPQALSFDGEVGTRVLQAVDVRNLGTGQLTLSLGGLATGSRFQLDAVPADIVPNRCGQLIISFNAPAAASTISELYTAQTNDKHAIESAHHNDRIRLNARTTHTDSGGGQGGSEGGSAPPGEGFGACAHPPRCPGRCPRFTSRTGPLAHHPVLGRRCQSFNCGHDMDQHRPPQ